MSRQTIAKILGVIGTLFFISIGFSLLPTNYALFLGIACYVISGAVLRIKGERRL